MFPTTLHREREKREKIHPRKRGKRKVLSPKLPPQPAVTWPYSNYSRGRPFLVYFIFVFYNAYIVWWDKLCWWRDLHFFEVRNLNFPRFSPGDWITYYWNVVQLQYVYFIKSLRNSENSIDYSTRSRCIYIKLMNYLKSCFSQNFQEAMKSAYSKSEARATRGKYTRARAALI